MQPWRTAIVNKDETHIWIRGYDITQLMGQAGFVDTVFLLHRGRLPNPGERRLLDALLVASADHGAGAPSCATARLAASGNRGSLSAAVAAGILAIGDEHGGAGEICMKLIADYVPAGKRASRSEGGVQGAPPIKSEGGVQGTPPIKSEGGVQGASPIKSMDEAAAAAIESARQDGGRLPGLGHRIHTTDPRVAVLFDMAADVGIAGDGIAFMRALEAAAARLIKPLPINIDGALAGVLYDMGFPPSAAKLIFIVGRVAGLTAEVAEEHAREKAMRVRIPIEYDGEPPREIEKTQE